MNEHCEECGEFLLAGVKVYCEKCLDADFAKNASDGVLKVSESDLNICKWLNR